MTYDTNLVQSIAPEQTGHLLFEFLRKYETFNFINIINFELKEYLTTHIIRQQNDSAVVVTNPFCQTKQVSITD